MNPMERFLTACRGGTPDRPPVWIMRQAGRTLPEYRAVRERHSFWEICTTPALAAEVTLQPVRRFPLDAAIIFSDILVVPQAMGMQVEFRPEPHLSPPVATAADIDRLDPVGAVGRLDYVAEALRLVRAELGPGRPVLGFAGAPFTLASYMIEGGGSRQYRAVKSALFRGPELFSDLLDRIAGAVGGFLRLQIEAGAAAVQLFDSWAGELAPDDFARFALPPVRRIVAELAGTGVPVIYYINGIGNLLEAAADSGAGVIGLDWRIDIGTARRRLGPSRPVQGNLDPCLLFGPPELIRQRTFAMLRAAGPAGHIANLGHGVDPATPISGIAAFVEAVGQWPEVRDV